MRIVTDETIGMALKTVRENKMRSLLTITGVVIGIMALIVVASLLVGLDKDMRAFLEDFGTDTLFVYKMNLGVNFGRPSAEERNRKDLTLEDAMAIKEGASAVKNVAAEVFPGFQGQQVMSARYKDHEVFNLQFSGTLASYAEVYNAEITEGRFLTEADDLHRMNVAVVGHKIAEALFRDYGEEPLDKEILVGGHNYTIIGVLAERKGQFFRDDSADKLIVVPYHTFKKHYPAAKEHFLGVRAHPGMKAVAEDQTRQILRRTRGVPYDKPDNFDISSAEQLTNELRGIMSMIALLIVVVSSIGLLVGGVGVMNIMLLSVTERTREIGVRKAIGARRRDVILQFLSEAVVLTGIGGIIGVLGGVSISLLLNAVAPKVPSVVPMWAIFVGVGVAMSVGLFFGTYPAVKASRLDPVEALRYE